MTGAGDIPLRPAAQVMRLSRLGSLHQCRLSFMRQLTRRMARENWQFERARFDIDHTGVGVAVYTAHAPKHSYSLVAFAHDLPPEKRSDRVIAEAWDATFALFDGVPDQGDIDRLSQNVPLQEAGRISERELSLSRANRSVRLWAYVVDCLSRGAQPDPCEIDQVGYLMRTTAVYGSGKFGAADRENIADRPEMQTPFQAEMLSVYLTRWFVRDLINHMAAVKGRARAAPLDDQIAQSLGIGNSTGLGMAPFLINHPVLFNNWILARETALVRVRQIEHASANEMAQFQTLLSRSTRMIDHWQSAHDRQIEKLAQLRADMVKISRHIQNGLGTPYPWNALMTWATEKLGEEAQELIASLMLEPYGHLVDDLGTKMKQDSGDPPLDGRVPLRDMRAIVDHVFPWVAGTDWDAPENRARCWYVSEEKLEPRLGERFEEDITAYEQPLAPAYDAAMFVRACGDWDGGSPVGEFLRTHPEFRHIVQRLQITANHPYGEIQDNTIGADLMPIDMLRAKLSFFGATKFDPRSDRWVRITMYAGAPYPDTLTPETADLWVYPQ